MKGKERNSRIKLFRSGTWLNNVFELMNMHFRRYFPLAAKYDWQRCPFNSISLLEYPRYSAADDKRLRLRINYPRNFDWKDPFVDHHLVACSNLSRVQRTIYQLHAARFHPLPSPCSRCALVKKGAPPPWPGKTSKNPFIPVEISGCGREIARGFDNERGIYAGWKAGWMRHLNGHGTTAIDGPETSSSAEYSVEGGREWNDFSIHVFPIDFNRWNAEYQSKVALRRFFW